MAEETDNLLTGDQPAPQQAGLSAYEQASQAREAKITFQREQPSFNAPRSGAGTGSYEGDSAAREARISNRPDFFAPVKVDQFGNQTAVGQAASLSAPTASSNISRDIRGIMGRGGPRNQVEANRFKQWSNSTQGKTFGNLFAQLQGVKRKIGGEKEIERQLNDFYKTNMGGGPAPRSEEIEVDLGNQNDLDTEVATLDSGPSFQPSKVLQSLYS